MSRARGKAVHAGAPGAGAAVLACAALLAACDGIPAPNITPYPIPMSMDGGVVVVSLRIDDGSAVPAVIDTLSPLTVVDGVAARGEPVGEPERRRHELTILSAAGDAGVPRARFGNFDAFDLHPCAGQDAGDGQPCRLGFDGATQPLHAILGADLWSDYAIRFSFARRLLSLFPDVSGDDQARALLCDTVFRAPFYGGGTLLVSGAHINIIGYRTAMGACMLAEAPSATDAGVPLPVCPTESDAGPPPPALPRRHGGLNALFVLSTGLPITLVSESFHTRYLARCAELGVDCDTAVGAPETLYVASGPLSVRRTTLSGLTLVSEYSDQRGPCEELYANAFMVRCGNLAADVSCCGDSGSERDCSTAALPCPCEGQDEGRAFCRAAAAAMLRHTFPVAVISDAEPMLQALRDELRTELPELDGILAPSAVEPLEIDMDYPNNRVLLRCDPTRASQCATLPAIIDRDTRDDLQAYCRP
jgi:hypothetical protein